VLEPGAEKTPEQERSDDLLALIASFSGRLYGMRSHKQKELLQCATAVLTSPYPTMCVCPTKRRPMRCDS
jgi:putative resolvase